MERFLKNLEEHQNEVANLVLSFGMELDLDDELLNKCYQAGLKHDCGKIDVDLRVLLKPTKPNELEMNIIKNHVEYSVRRLCEANEDIKRGVYEHHENYDGSGYPQGLRGDEISLIGRLLRISDVYIALRRKRVYKVAFDHHDTIVIMEKEHKHYDPELFGEFKKYIIKKIKTDESCINKIESEEVAI